MAIHSGAPGLFFAPGESQSYEFDDYGVSRTITLKNTCGAGVAGKQSPFLLKTITGGGVRN
jgi:hypothetical protein